MKAPKPSEDYSCTADNVYRQREILFDALKTIAAGNTDPERMVEIAREAIAKTGGAQ
jgi:hypothetical protein